MANIIEMPKLSDTMTVGTLIKWLKKEGDPVKTGDILAEVETDKATMELESFFDGTLLSIFVKAGAQVPLGAALCAIGKPGEKVELSFLRDGTEKTVGLTLAAQKAEQTAKAEAEQSESVLNSASSWRPAKVNPESRSSASIRTGWRPARACRPEIPSLRFPASP